MIQFQFFAEAEGWIESLCHEGLATIKILSLKPAESDTDYVTHFVEIFSEGFSVDAINSKLEQSSNIRERDLARVGSNRLIGAVTSKGCGVCTTLVESNANCFVAPATTEENCRMSYKLFISGQGLPTLLQKLHERGIQYDISDVSPLSTKRKITTRQEKVLKSALELGYFEYPKRISSDDLAKLLGIKSGTLSEILRRAEKNVISSYFSTESA